MFTDPTTGALINGIAKVRYSHDAMIDLIISEPTIKQNDLAAIFDRSPTWVSLIMSSDAFQARLAERRAELVDPSIVASIQERIQAVASASLSKILDKLSSPLPASDDFLIQSAKLATGALGYGARPAAGSTTANVAVVIQVPQKAASAAEWVAQVAPQVA
jgi:hypothetical protein